MGDHDAPAVRQGELIFNHDGPIGKYQLLFLDPDFRKDIRLAIVAFGPHTLALGGRAFAV